MTHRCLGVAGRLVLAGAFVASLSPMLMAQDCPGDCDSSKTVTVEELVLGIHLVLRTLPPETCLVFDQDGDGTVTIDELLQAVAFALGDCSDVPLRPTPTATSTRSPTVDAVPSGSPTSTMVTLATPTFTRTIAPDATPTSSAAPTETREPTETRVSTETQVPTQTQPPQSPSPTATRTATQIPPTHTRTATPIPPTHTRTATLTRTPTRRPTPNPIPNDALNQFVPENDPTAQEALANQMWQVLTAPNCWDASVIAPVGSVTQYQFYGNFEYRHYGFSIYFGSIFVSAIGHYQGLPAAIVSTWTGELEGIVLIDNNTFAHVLPTPAGTGYFVTYYGASGGPCL